MRTFKRRNPKEVHVNIYIGILTNPKDLLDTWDPPMIAECHEALQGNVIALRVHNADLIRLRN